MKCVCVCVLVCNWFDECITPQEHRVAPDFTLGTLLMNEASVFLLSRQTCGAVVCPTPLILGFAGAQWRCYAALNTLTLHAYVWSSSPSLKYYVRMSSKNSFHCLVWRLQVVSSDFKVIFAVVVVGKCCHTRSPPFRADYLLIFMIAHTSNGAIHNQNPGFCSVEMYMCYFRHSNLIPRCNCGDMQLSGECLSVTTVTWLTVNSCLSSVK